MNFRYLAYGLQLTSDLPIPGLLASSGKASPDVEIWLGSRPAWLAECSAAAERVWYVSPEREDGDRPSLTVAQLNSGTHFRLDYFDGVTFVIDRGATRLWAAWPAPLTLDYTATYLLGPVMGFVLRLRGIACLHASAVAVGNQAIALVGGAGAGKSTTAAAFAQRGYAVLCDDVLPLEPQADCFLVRPGYPRLCLWPEAVHALYGAPEALPRLTPNWEKCYLALDGPLHSFQREPLPLGAIYLLGGRSADAFAPRVRAASPRAGLLALVRHTYMNYLPSKDWRAQEFDLLGRLLERVPLREAWSHTEPAYLSRLCELIANDFAGFSATPQLATKASSV